RLVVDGQELLAHRKRHRVQPCARPACENNALHLGSPSLDRSQSCAPPRTRAPSANIANKQMVTRISLSCAKAGGWKCNRAPLPFSADSEWPSCVKSRSIWGCSKCPLGQDPGCSANFGRLMSLASAISSDLPYSRSALSLL